MFYSDSKYSHRGSWFSFENCRVRRYMRAFRDENFKLYLLFFFQIVLQIIFTVMCWFFFFQELLPSLKLLPRCSGLPLLKPCCCWISEFDLRVTASFQNATIIPVCFLLSGCIKRRRTCDESWFSRSQPWGKTSIYNLRSTSICLRSPALHSTLANTDIWIACIFLNAN